MNMSVVQRVTENPTRVSPPRHAARQHRVNKMTHGTDNISLLIKEFGCHLQWKELEKIDGLTLQTYQKVLRDETWDYSERPTYFTAVRNLQGFIEYGLGNEAEAEDFFEVVLEHDPLNINALANMVYVLNGQCRSDQMRDYQMRLRDIFGRIKQSYPQRARAYADRAHAIRYFEQDKRCFHYMTYVERAATIGRFCHDSPERAEWFFDHALALYRRDVQMLYLRKLSGSDVSDVMQRKIKSGFERAVRLFYDVIQLSHSKAYLSLSWVFIGILLNHDPNCRYLASMFPSDHEVAGMTAEDCYMLGLSIHDTHDITTRRVGSEYVKLGRYQEAKQLLDRSIGILKSWFAHRYRGVLYLSMYEDQSLTDQDLLTQFGVSCRTNLLHMAKDDFQKAQEERKVHADFSDLGQVYFLLGQHRNAIAKFKTAIDSEQDDYFDILETYRRWIKCVGEDNAQEVAELRRNAEARRQRLLETPLDPNGDSFNDDFDNYCRSSIYGHVQLLNEADFWVATRTGRTRHNPMPYEGPIPSDQCKYDFFLSFSQRDRIWSLALLSKLETEFHLRGCVEERDFVIGVDLMRNIATCLRDSHRCIVVLSQHYVQDGESKAILREALRVGFMRDGPYVLPVVLADCEVGKLDTRLQEVTRVMCNMGQIPTNHWRNLVTSLRQQSDKELNNLNTLCGLLSLILLLPGLRL